MEQHHGSEGGFWPANVGSPGFDGFVDFIVKPYFGFLPGDPVFWSAIHDYIEFWGGLFIALGFLTRPSAGLLFVPCSELSISIWRAPGCKGFLSATSTTTRTTGKSLRFTPSSTLLSLSLVQVRCQSMKRLLNSLMSLRWSSEIHRDCMELLSVAKKHVIGW